MNRMILAILLIASISVQSFAQSTHVLDGSNWLSWSNDLKVGYVFGYIEGIDSARRLIEIGKNENKNNTASVSFANRVEGRLLITNDTEAICNRLDQFYSDEAKRAFPLRVVLMLVGKIGSN